MEGTDYRGVPVFAAAQPVPGTSWHVVAKLDSAEVLAPVRRRGLLTAGVTVLLVALAGLATLLVWRRRETQVGEELLARERQYRSLVENLSRASWCTPRTPASPTQTHARANFSA